MDSYRDPYVVHIYEEYHYLHTEFVKIITVGGELAVGPSAVQPTVYLTIPNYDKVSVKYTLGWIFFRCSFTQIIYYGWSFI